MAYRIRLIITMILLMSAFFTERLQAANSDLVAAGKIGMNHPQLVSSFYQLQSQPLFWFSPGNEHQQLREALLSSIDGVGKSGLDPSKYHQQQIAHLQAPVSMNEAQLNWADHVFTDAAITLCKDLYQGDQIDRMLSYDGLSKKYALADDSFILSKLATIRKPIDLSNLLTSLEPAGTNYQLLKQELQDCTIDCNILKTHQLISSMNYFRWISHFRLDSFIVVNISAATLKYYVHDTLALEMRTVLGKPDTKTPRFAAYCKEVTLYPYWNMPRSIAVKEWLPTFKKNPGMITFLNMEVINQAGKVVAVEAIDWKRVSVEQFPYRIRQKTGCLNPMGVLKFTLTSPFDVYMHDTNFKGPFEAKNRYYSHGCIRLQEPAALANALLVNKVDTGYLAACYQNQKPQVIAIENPVPVFVVYLTAEVNDEGQIAYYKDIYNLLK